MEYEQIPIGNAKDLTNKKFGTLKVLYRTKNLGTRTMWVCQCDCGTVKPVAAQYLTKAKDPSCGCQNRKKASERMKNYNLSQSNLKIGDKIGYLTIIDYAGLRKQNSRNKQESWFVCKCRCGNIKEIRGNDLQQHSVISCGCIKSLGERTIEAILKENNISYKKEYSFSDLINPSTNHHLRFDFAVFNEDGTINFLIEFDGRQHTTGPEAKWTHSSSLEEIQYRDNLKNQYCIDHDLILKRISYVNLFKINKKNLFDDTFNFKKE